MLKSALIDDSLVKTCRVENKQLNKVTAGPVAREGLRARGCMRGFARARGSREGLPARGVPVARKG